MKIKQLLIALLAFISIALVSAPQVQAVKYVRSYYKPSTSKYVKSYYRTNANTYKYDHYSAKYNYNPFTGKKGYKSWY